MVNFRHTITLDDADAYITNVSFAPTTISSSTSTSSSNNTTAISNTTNQPILMMTTSEDDTCRLYDLNTSLVSPPPLSSNNNIAKANSNYNQNNTTNIKIANTLRASYSLPEIGTHKCIFTQEGNASCLLAPRNRSPNHQIYGLDLETGTLVASYLIHQNHTIQQKPIVGSLSGAAALIPKQHYTPWFCSLTTHPTARGVFAASGEDSNVFFCHAGVSSPIAKLSSISVGRSVVEFSPNGNLFAVGDREYLNVYDWRRMSINEGPVSQYKVKEFLHASRWLQDVGSVTGLHFHPNSNNNEFDAKKLLVTTSRYIVRTIDHTVGGARFQNNNVNASLLKDKTTPASSSSSGNNEVVLETFGASGAAASHLPNERPAYYKDKRVIPTAARFSPVDGRYVSCGTCMNRIAIFDCKKGREHEDENENDQDEFKVKKEEDEAEDQKPLTPSNSANSRDPMVLSVKKKPGGNHQPHAATLSHVLHGSHMGAVSVAEWCPGMPALVSTDKVATVWRVT